MRPRGGPGPDRTVSVAGVRRRRPPLREVGTEPDPRFSYANERTFLAWNRTALALIAAGLAVVTLLPELEVEYGRRIIGVPLILLGALLALTSYRRWEDNERAMRRREPLPASNLPKLLAAGIVAAAVLAAVVAAFGSTGSG
ncbi:MAG: membrane protein [Acidimicrobiia bacterium]|nr:MAG: membrane protein [Acidimicrobiia bacterium]